MWPLLFEHTKEWRTGVEDLEETQVMKKKQRPSTWVRTRRTNTEGRIRLISRDVTEEAETSTDSDDDDDDDDDGSPFILTLRHGQP